MADITNTPPVSGLQAGAIRWFFARAYDLLIRVASNSSRAKAVDALNKLSDEDLAARGTDRRTEVLRIIGPAYYV